MEIYYMVTMVTYNIGIHIINDISVWFNNKRVISWNFYGS
jgi:hypothetical protein